MSGTLRRSLLSLFLAYSIVLTLCFSASKPSVEASTDLKPRKTFQAHSILQNEFTSKVKARHVPDAVNANY